MLWSAKTFRGRLTFFVDSKMLLYSGQYFYVGGWFVEMFKITYIVYNYVGSKRSI